MEHSELSVPQDETPRCLQDSSELGTAGALLEVLLASGLQRDAYPLLDATPEHVWTSPEMNVVHMVMRVCTVVRT